MYSGLKRARRLLAVCGSPWVSALVLATAGAVLLVGWSEGRFTKSVTYLGVVAAGAWLTDRFSRWQPNAPPMPVRTPLREARWLVGFCLVGYAVLLGRFVWLDWEGLPRLAKLAFLPLFGFVFPVFSATLLLAWKYRPRELGFHWCASAWVCAPVLVLVAAAAWCVAPEDMTWAPALRSEGGWFALLFQGLISSALCEEFLRLTLQTRLSAVWSRGPAWLLTAFLWAFLHLPKALGEGAPLLECALGSLYIVPIGLLWGFMTHRTRSIWPATICHALNYWGLQNL